MVAIDECGFDPTQWTEDDVRGTLRLVHVWLGWLAEGAPPEILAALRPDAETILTARRDLDTFDAELSELHKVWHALDHAGRIRHRDTAPQQGTVVQMSASAGGVPKLPIQGPVQIDWSGVVSDRQDDRYNHGRPWQAVCLWSQEVIDGLVAEGHPIHPGAAGENITVAGLDWSKVTPGLRMQIGTTRLETTAYTIPCYKNAQWFLDGYFRRMTHDLYPGESRIYARVLEPGVVQAGDTVQVLP